MFQKSVQNIGLAIPTQNVLLNEYFDIVGYSQPFESEGINTLYVLMKYKLLVDP